MNYEQQDRDFCKAPNPRMFVAIENKRPSDEKCPLCNECLETDHYFKKYGVCGCIVWNKWNDALTTETFEEYVKSNYKQLN